MAKPILGPPTAHQTCAMEFVAKMEPWWRDIDKMKKADSEDGRTMNQQCFDAGVHAAAELIRRWKRDEDLSVAMHELTFWARRERQSMATTERTV